MNAKNITAIVSATSRTDWVRLARRDDSQIDYSDAPPTKPDKRRRMRVRLPDGRRLPVK